MDVILLFMKLEDKYWGIFLAALFFLLVWHLKKENRKILYLIVYAFAVYLIFLCKPLYDLVEKFFSKDVSYYQLSHAQLMVLVIVLAGVLACEMASGQGKGKAAVFLAGMAVVLFLAGDFAYIPNSNVRYQARVTREEKQAFDLLLTHAKQVGDTDKLKIWGMEELMAKSRIYHQDFMPVYGKDIGENPEHYPEAEKMMYAGYSSYDVREGTAINIADQLDALSLMPHQYPEVGCEYLILYDPKYQFEDYETFFGEDGFDAATHVSALGYDCVGRTEHLLLFYKKEG